MLRVVGACANFARFAPSGDPEGIRVVTRDDWPGKTVIFPRHLPSEVKRRKELSQPITYLLAGGKFFRLRKMILWVLIA
ncbi:MAG: hypothetical protein WBI05_03235 [Rhodoferax sp.]|uniref:hypothetical protein n=1 Tax=Rhodoferax sp. TaxID=50421 RepID=UPI003C777F49